jgi:Protein of unknown function (DUF2752).
MESIFLSLADWLEKHSLPCFYKHYLGMECPGCGAQRAFIELLRGHVWQSVKMYPALIPILFMLFYLALHLKFKFRNGARNIKILFIVCSIIVVFNYIYKLF